MANGSLLAEDFASGALPRGPQGARGPQGIQGIQGPKGDTGTVDTSGFYTKTDSDARFLGIAATAADSDLLDGRTSFDFVRDFQTVETQTIMALAAGATHTQNANCPAGMEALGGGGYNAQDNGTWCWTSIPPSIDRSERPRLRRLPNLDPWGNVVDPRSVRGRPVGGSGT